MSRVNRRPVLALAGALCGAVACAVQAADIAQIEKSVVRIITVGADDIGTGSGFVIDTGRVLTNHHVVANGRVFFAVSKYTSEKKPARMIWAAPELDLAVLLVDGLDLPAATVASALPAKGEAVWALGYPSASDYGTVSLDATVNRGVIGLFHRAPWVNTDSTRPVHIIQHDAAINRGNSGGPLFDDCGRVVGVNTQKEADADGVFLALRITEALEGLAGVGIRPALDGESCTTDEPATDTAARADALLAREQADHARTEAQLAGEQASRAEDEARRARQAASETTELLSDTQEAIGRAEERNRLVNTAIGVLALLSLVLALRRPRQQLIKVIEKMPFAQSLLSQKRPARRPTAFMLSGAGVRRQLPWPALDVQAGGFVIGAREELVDWSVEDARLAPRHARLYQRDHRLEIEDLNTTLGTFVNGRRLPVFLPWPVRAGDRITLGELTFTLTLQR